jgi:hypothetical protein
VLWGSSEFSLLPRPRPPNFPHLFRPRATRQLLLCVLVPRRNETRQRTTRTSTSSLPPAAAALHRPQRPVMTLPCCVVRQPFLFLLRSQPPKFPHLYRPRATRQLLLCVLVPRRNETGTRKAVAQCGPPVWAALTSLQRPPRPHPLKALFPRFRRALARSIKGAGSDILCFFFEMLTLKGVVKNNINGGRSDMTSRRHRNKFRPERTYAPAEHNDQPRAAISGNEQDCAARSEA